MNSLQVDGLNFNNNLKINFTGGALSSDTGLLAYRAFAEQIGLMSLVQDVFDDKKRVGYTYYQASDILMQNIFKCLAGYHTDAASNTLRHDPVFGAILQTAHTASQPTVSRRMNATDVAYFKKLETLNRALLDNAYRIHPPEHVIFDLDSTSVKTHGKQYGCDYNAHYNNQSYHPLMLFDGMTGDLIKAELRSGNVYTSRQVVRFLGPVLKHDIKQRPTCYKIIRADSGFALPALYELAETLDVIYTIRLKSNPSLQHHLKDAMYEFNDLYDQDYSKAHTLYGEFDYQAASWEKSRRVCYKIKRKDGELIANTMFVVTTMNASPKDVLRFYAKRGEMENFIKEAKHDFAIDTLSHHHFMTNANRMMQRLLAYNLHNLMRRLCMSSHDRKTHMCTIRTKLIKVAGKLTRSARYQIFKLCSGYPYQRFFVKLFERINSMPLFS